MSRVNLRNARSHIVFIVGLIAAATYILWVEGYIGGDKRRMADAPRNAWSVHVGAISTADQARQICGAATLAKVECTVVPPISGEAP